MSLHNAVAELSGVLIGAELPDRYHAWPMYAWFFDNLGALPFHIHHDDTHAALVKALGKPEAHYLPPAKPARRVGGRAPAMSPPVT
ncbi:MAG: hypothetical protein C4536_12235 [Actinobacteria bacterium]|nr:MAG: hypothetical protein C4536_12235 [Actinomycetota bacterium]